MGINFGSRRECSGYKENRGEGETREEEKETSTRRSSVGELTRLGGVRVAIDSFIWG